MVVETKQIEYRLHERQRLIFDDDSRFIVLVAGRRWGKTILAVFKIIQAALSKEAKVWYVSPLYRQSKDIAWKLLKKYLPKEAIFKINESELTISLRNNSEIALKGADNPESLLGVGLNYVVLDEYASMKQDVWQEIIRPMLTDTLGKALFIGTPKGKNHFWELYIKGQRRELGYLSYHFPTETNPYIQPEEIEQAREQLDPRFFRQEYEASFEDFTGLVYPEFDKRKHCIQELPTLTGLTSVVGIDPALSGVHAWLLAYVLKNGAFLFIKEYYEKDRRVDEVTASLPKGANRYLIDPVYGLERLIPREGKLFTFVDEYRRFGIPVMPGETDKPAGIQRFRQYLHSQNIVIYEPGCPNFCWELERYHYPRERETVRGQVEPMPYKKDDHLCDASRIIIMSRASTREEKKQEKLSKMCVAYDQREDEKETANWRNIWQK